MMSQKESETEPHILLYPSTKTGMQWGLCGGEKIKKKGEKKEGGFVQKGKGDEAISVATAAGNSKALCNVTYGIFGLFSALTHRLLARTRNGP